MDSFLIVRAEKCHLEGIAEVEKECFSLPRSYEALLEDFLNPNFSMFAAVLPLSEKVIGWSGLTDVFGAGEVADIAVLKEFRGMGAGFALSKALIDECREKKMDSLILEVRESNESAKKIYKALGFKEIAVRKNFYEYPRENGISMIIDF